MRAVPRRGIALDEVDDAFLVGRAADGDVRAFEVLLQRHGPALRRYLARLMRNSADVDDVLQNTTLIAWQRLGDLREPGRVRGWLFQIATREAVQQQRRYPPTAELTDDVRAVPGPETGLGALDLRRDLGAALDALPEQQARCWILREFGGYRYGEIAEELGVPESTVRGALAAARRSILRTMGGAR